MHLAGNMLYLWIFGNNIEDVMGHGRYLVFYLVCGLAAAMAQALPDMGSTVPMIGASGAISAFSAPICSCFRKRGCRWSSRRFLHDAHDIRGLAARYLDHVSSAQRRRFGHVGGGVAWWAHVGGFVAGMARFISSAKRPSTALEPYALPSRQPAKPTGRSRIPDSRSVGPSDSGGGRRPRTSSRQPEAAAEVGSAAPAPSTRSTDCSEAA